MRAYGYFFVEDDSNQIIPIKVLDGDKVDSEETIKNLIATTKNLNSALTGYMYMIQG